MKQNLKKEILKSKKDRPKKKLIALRLPDDLHDELQKLAADTDESLTGVVLFLIKKGMGKNE